MKKQESNQSSFARIISIDGSDLLKRSVTVLKNGKLNPDAFRGMMDQSLDTMKLAEVCKKHKAELPFPYLSDKQFCRAVVNVSFDYSVKQFEQYGRRFVRYGHPVADADVTDHVCVRDGKLIAIEVPYSNNSSYVPSSLKTVVITGGTSIGDYAFVWCSRLTSITIGNGVTSIGRYAFYNCSGLTSITFANTSGWYVTETSGASSGTNMSVTNASTNATNLRSTYSAYYWYRK